MGNRDFDRPIRAIAEISARRVTATKVAGIRRSGVVSLWAGAAVLVLCGLYAAGKIANPDAHGLTRATEGDVSEILTSPLPTGPKRAAALERRYTWGERIVEDMLREKREGGPVARHAEIFLERLRRKIEDG